MGGKVVAIAAVTLALAAAPALADGQLAIQSKPSGATVSLDGSYAGPTPVLLDAPAGRYHIRVSMPGRAPQTFTATVRDGLTTRRVVTLAPPRPATGELVVRTRPAGATVVLDGRVVGASPLHLEGLAPGRHHLRAVMNGHLAVARTVSVHGGLTASVSLGLEETAPPAPAPVAERPKPAPKPTQRPAPQQAIAQAAPKPAVPAASKPTVPAPRHVTPVVPEAAAPEVVAIAPPPEVPTRPIEPLDPRPWLFAGLMTLLFAWGVKHVKPSWPARSAKPAPWHLERGPVGIASWPDEGAPSGAAFAAVAAMGRGHWQLGLDALWQAIEAEPAGAWHYYHVGVALEQLGRVEEAEGAYRTAAQLDPNWAPPAYNLGVLLARTGQPALAVIAYRRLLEAQPDHADAQFNLGHAYLALGNPERALAHWRALAKTHPRDAEVRANLKRLRRVAPRRPGRLIGRDLLRRAS